MGSLSMRRSKLCISWIQQQFIAVVVVRGELSESWESPRPIIELAEFNFALAEAIETLNVHAGSDVFIVYESDFLSHPLVPIPTMNGRDRISFLERKARQEKNFEEDALWSFTQTLESRDGTSVLLHLIPKTFVDALVRILEEFKLHPVSMLPLSDAMSVHLASLSGDADEICMLLNIFPDQCEILIARGDGVILFVRDLGYSWVGNEDRLGIEIERSVLFAGQHFKGNISRMWISSENSEQVVDYLRNQVTMPMLSLSSDSSIDWLAVTGMPSAHLHSNLIPRHIRKKRMMLWMFRGSAMLVLLLGLLSAVTVWEIERIIHNQGAHTNEVIAEINQWQSKKDSLINKASQLQDMVNRGKAFDESVISPAAPAWFAQYIASILPDGMVLSHLSMQRAHQTVTESTSEEVMQDRGWQFTIQGMFNDTHQRSFAQVLKAFETSLTVSPLNARILQSWRMNWLKQIQTGNTGKSTTRSFVIKGQIQ